MARNPGRAAVRSWGTFESLSTHFCYISGSGWGLNLELSLHLKSEFSNRLVPSPACPHAAAVPTTDKYTQVQVCLCSCLAVRIVQTAAQAAPLR